MNYKRNMLSILKKQPREIVPNVTQKRNNKKLKTTKYKIQRKYTYKINSREMHLP